MATPRTLLAVIALVVSAAGCCRTEEITIGVRRSQNEQHWPCIALCARKMPEDNAGAKCSRSYEFVHCDDFLDDDGSYSAECIYVETFCITGP